MTSSPLTLSMPLADVRSLAATSVPATADDGEVAGWAARQVHRLGGTARPHLHGEQVVVEWTPDSRRRSGTAETVDWLRAGQLHEAAVVMELLLSAEPDDETLLYNLGMAHSDLGNLARAEVLLRRCVGVDPTRTNARVALGVALLRQNQTAEAATLLEQALAEEPENAWAHRNLAVALQRTGDIDGAIRHLRTTVALNPTDERGWIGLGKALELSGELAEADEAYVKAIELAGFGEAAEIAQQGRSRIAESAFRTSGGGPERPDAVMYCVAALECFAIMSEAEVRHVVMEIASLGRQGLDVNNPGHAYRLNSLPGQFTGLQLVSYLYVGSKQIALGADVGFDLSREYEAARSLYRHGPAPTATAVE